MNYVYILKCTDNSFYTGWTSDLLRRYRMHCKGKGAKYTRAHLPTAIVYYEVFDTKQEAMRREWHIKQMTRKEKEILAEGFDDPLNLLSHTAKTMEVSSH